MLIYQNSVDNRCVFGIVHFKCYFTYHIVQLDTKYTQQNSEKSVTQTINMETGMILLHFCRHHKMYLLHDFGL